MKTPTRFPVPTPTGRHGFEPTFPLDEVEKNARLAAGKMGHPLTWLVPCVFGLGMLAAAPVLPVPVSLALTGVAATLWMKACWRRLDEPVRARVEREMIDESNRRQNERLQEIMRGFRACGAGHYASVVARFLGEKRRCESRIGEERSHFSTVEKMENLVDGLCSGACRELDHLIRLDRRLAEVLVSRDSERLEGLESRRRNHLEKVFDAYTVIADSAEMLEKGNRFVPEASAEVHSRSGETDELDRTIDELRHETAIARRVRERMAVTEEVETGAMADRGLAISA